MPDITVHDNLTITERVTRYKIDDFSEFARGYPYQITPLTGEEEIEFESGVKQFIDTWGGRTKMVIEINFPVSTKDEAMPIFNYYLDKIGKKFYFTDPVTGNRYIVKFRKDSYRLERRHYNTYFASVILEEV